MKEIPLTQGLVALVDDEDYDFLVQWKWRAIWDNSSKTYYAIRSEGKSAFSMHRAIMAIDEKRLVDHKDHNGLNNTRMNLRPCTDSQSSANTRKRLGCSSKYKGVYWHKKSSNWMALIRVDYIRIYLGSYDNEVDAAKAYNKAALEHFGEFAYLNEIAS